MPNRPQDPANLYPYLWVQWSGETVERLIRSTQELFWERGYVETSPKAIQRVAEAGQGSMYHHFAGKAGVLVDVDRGREHLTTTS